MKYLAVAAFLLMPASLFAQHKTHLTCVAPAPVAGVTVTGYNFYRSDVKGGPYTKLNSTPTTTCVYDDATVQTGKRYYYVATAVATSDESLNSNESSADINPSAPTGLTGTTK